MINKKIFNHVNIHSIGVYIPQLRITTASIAKTHNKDGESVTQALGLTQKSLGAHDEDALTMAVSAATQAITNSKFDKNKIGAIYVGSESHPYAVKPTSSMVGEWLGLKHDYFAADLEFACKAGTAGIQIIAGMIESGMIDAGLAIGSDKAQSQPGDALEYAASSCAVAFLLTKKKGVAKLNCTTSFTSDTPDFWRRQTEAHPQHAGRFTGEPAYFRHILGGTNQLLNTYNKKISNFDHIVFHMPNAKFPQKAAKILNVSKKQLETGLTVKQIGNPYSSSSMLGLARVLHQAKKNQEILTTSYGSGSGSDSFWFTQTKKMTTKFQQQLENQFNNTKEVDYLTYLKHMKIL